MFYRVSAKFINTESAQQAAQRINRIPEGIYEIRLDYRSENENDNVMYAGGNSADLPYGYGMKSRYSNPLNSLPSIPKGEEPQECYMAIYCKPEARDKISQIIINSGGYDMYAAEEKPL